MGFPPSTPPDHRSFARWLIGTEPIALVLLLVLAVTLFALIMLGRHHPDAVPAQSPQTSQPVIASPPPDASTGTDHS